MKKQYTLLNNTTALRMVAISILFGIGLPGFHIPLISQSCSCTVDEVQTKTVKSCDLIVGNVILVSSAAEFRNAIQQANSSGGNMTILIQDGVYSIATSASYPYITASNVVIRSQSGNRDDVILQGTGMRPASSTENVLGIAGNHITIADLTLQECGNHGIQVSGSHLTVHNVHFKNIYEQMLKGATTGVSIDSAIVQCSLFEYTSGVGPNYYIGGLDIHKGRNWVVRDNVFKHIKSPSGSVAEHAIHFWNNSSNNIVERNLILHCDRGIGFGLGNSPNNGGIIRNNMIYNDGSGIFTDVGIGLETSPETKVFNNTIYIPYQNAIEYRFAATSNVEIINNLTNKTIRSRDGGSGSTLTNIQSAQAGWFKNIMEGDLHLAFKIPTIIDQGTNLISFVPDDFDKMERPQNSTFDIGADEFQFETAVHPETLKFNALDIFPNPCKDGIFYIVFKNNNLHFPMDVYIQSISGEIKISQNYNTPNSLNPIVCTGLSSGMYIVRIIAQGNQVMGKLIIL